MLNVRRIISQDLHKIDGWCPVDKAHIMVNLVEQYGVKNFLELGVFGGRSLLPVALAIKVLQADQGQSVSIVGVDAWAVNASVEGYSNDLTNVHPAWWSKINHEEFYDKTKDLMKRYGVDSIVKLVKMPSQDYYDQVPDKSLDMIHQDSNHTEIVSQREVMLYWDKVRPGGWWIFDDTNWETTKPAQALLESKGYICREDHEIWKVYQRSE